MTAAAWHGTDMPVPPEPFEIYKEKTRGGKVALL